MLMPMALRLPFTWLNSAVLATLSNDLQAYVRCASCGWERRLDTFGVADGESRLDSRCPQCGEQRSSFTQHVLTGRLCCADCGQEDQVSVLPAMEMACGRCGSRRVDLLDAKVLPPFPTRFGDVRTLPSLTAHDDVPHVWGESGIEDAKRVFAESEQLRLMPDSHRFRFSLIWFAARLCGEARESSDEERYWLANAAGNLAWDYLRATGSVEYGAMALDYYTDMVELAADDVNRAIAQHSFAMGVFSMLVRFPEEYAAAFARIPDLRATAVALAIDSDEILSRYADEHPMLARQRARVRYVIGDLVRVGAVDDDERRIAIDYFTLSLEDPWVQENLGFAISSSRAETIFSLATLDDDLFDMAVADLNLAAQAGGNDDAHRERWRAQLLLGQLVWRHQSREEAISLLESAAAHALQQFSALSDEIQLVYQAERLVEAFNTLAALYVDLGWVDEALSTIELARGSALRRYTMADDELRSWIDEVELRRREDMWPAILKDVDFHPFSPRVSRRSMDELFEDNPIGPAVKACLNHHDGIDTGFLCLFFDQRVEGVEVASALLCTLDEPDGWLNRRIVWKPDAEALSFLRRQSYVAPGPFREPLLKKACELGQTLLDPILDAVAETGVKRVVLSVPGILGRLPFEAFGSETGSSDHGRPIFAYLPSVRFGADLLRGAEASVGHDREEAKVLVVGYDGDDMPRERDELARLDQIWGANLTIVSGAECTKQKVLEALTGPFDIIHVLCHGTFNHAAPMLSALHFSPDSDDDSRQVTAEDLAMRVKLTRRPLVVMSACSSGMTADSRTNSYHGLPGALFRIGARAVIGSRWPVHDDAAASLMSALHAQLRATAAPADACLDRAREEVRGDGAAIEDWAAFGYFGVA